MFDTFWWSMVNNNRDGIERRRSRPSQRYGGLYPGRVFSRTQDEMIIIIDRSGFWSGVMLRSVSVRIKRYVVD